MTIFLPDPPRAGRLRDIEGNVPLPVVLWFEHHPTASLAAALASSATSVRWLFRISSTQTVVLRGARIEVVDTATGTRTGTARVHGVRSAADFDTLPNAVDPPPFAPPEVPYPSMSGFACDRDGAVARFHPLEGPASVGPGLTPRLSSYDLGEPHLETMVAALSVSHTRVSYPTAAFAARVPDLVRVLEEASGSARLFSWFEGLRVVIWPAAPADVVTSVVSALHTRNQCLGCSRHDPRDALARGTYSYGRGPRSTLASIARDDVPDQPLDVAAAAALLGRSTAELAATQLDVQFQHATRVDFSRIRRAM